MKSSIIVKERHISILSNSSVIALQAETYQKQGHPEIMQKACHITHCSWLAEEWMMWVNFYQTWLSSEPTIHAEQSAVCMQSSL